MALALRQRQALRVAQLCGRHSTTHNVGIKVREAAASRGTSARAFSQAAGHRWWDRHIHIPDVPTWALLAGGAGAGGLMYYYNFYKRGSHAHAEPWTGPGYTQDYKGAAALPPEAAAAPLPTIPLPPFQATDVAKGTPVTPDDLEDTAVILVFVDPTQPAALDGLERLQDVTAQAGRSSKVPLQPLALDMTSGEPAERSKLARLLTDLESHKKGRADPAIPPILGLAGNDAADKVKDSVQRFAESPAAGGAAVEPEAVTEEGVLHLFGPDGMLVIQYDATLLPADVAKDVVQKLQDFEQRSTAQRSPG